MIKVFDAIMGSGKTTFAIKHMNANKEDKYIYITPNLTECDRVAKACPKLYFKHPSNSKGTKLKDLQKLVEMNENIVSTHSLLSNFTLETIELLKNRNYHLILDEAIEPCTRYEIKETDINMLFKSEYIEVLDDGVTLTWIGEQPQQGSKFYQEYKLIENQNLVTFDFHNSKSNRKVFVWELTKSLLKCFISTTVLTYQFNGSILRSYLGIKDIPYEIDTKTLSNKKRIGHLIKIWEEDSLNAIGKNNQSLASSLKGDRLTCSKLRGNIINYVKHKLKAKSNQVMWTTFKDAKDKLKAKGYTKGYVVHNQKATNEYSHKNILIYALNRFMDVPIKQYLEQQGAKVNQDLWSLNEMLQWIFRSAIRNNEPIYIYIPSSRMRGLLKEWIGAN